MKYYRITFTLNPELRGSNDYIKEYKLKIPNGKMYWDEPLFIGNVRNEKINFQPYLLEIELFEKSKLNDYVLDGGPTSGKPILSGKLKSILEKSRNTGLQFFNINLVKKESVFEDYWILNMYEINQEYIDFEKSRIIYQEKASDFDSSFLVNEKIINIKNQEEFDKSVDKAKENSELIWIDKVFLKNNIEENFFALDYVNGGVGYFVSEKLMQEIEDVGCIGLEFQPSELSFDEWTSKGGEREKIYGKYF